MEHELPSAPGCRPSNAVSRAEPTLRIWERPRSIAVTMATAVAVSAAATDPVEQYADVHAGHWADCAVCDAGTWPDE